MTRKETFAGTVAAAIAVAVCLWGCSRTSDEKKTAPRQEDGGGKAAVGPEKPLPPDPKPIEVPPVVPPQPPDRLPPELTHGPEVKPIETTKPGNGAGNPSDVVPNPLRDPPNVPPESPTSGEPAKKSNRLSKKQRIEEFDPVKENGPIFVGWPKPPSLKLALVITGREDGYLEPCGCAGLDRMKGGMSRRHTLLRQLRGDGWPVVAIDAGGIAKGFGRQAELKFQTAVEGMRKMAYDAIALGASDLRLPAGELVAVAAGVDGKPGPFVSANVGLFGFEAAITPKLKLLEAGGRKVGVTAVLGKQFQKQINNDEIAMADPETAIAGVLPELKKADYRVLLAHATVEESIALGKRFPDFDLVVTSGGAAEPPSRPAMIEGTKAMLVEVGEKGMNAVVLGFFDDPKEPIRYQRVPLDSRFPGSLEMKLLMRAYQDQVKSLGFAGLNIRSVPHPQRELNGRFVGSQKCESCHEESYKIWKKSGHAKAFRTLEELDPPRQFDPECISCHVVGWHPTKYFPYEGGFMSKAETPKLTDTGCETCHGPGEAHCDAELSGSKELKERLRKSVAITKAESEKHQCYTCHDLDNSPDFDFKTYWPDIEHYEK